MHNQTSPLVLDDAAVTGALGGPLARLKLVRELAQIKQTLQGLPDGPMAALQRLKLVSHANEIRLAEGE
ncbi:hypothetical protein HZU77_013540 [Neisseriaceae bacterium TC5R-5]|nr:hypothetical protein [Neisseriaceae bacterium TC5R-5]